MIVATGSDSEQVRVFIEGSEAVALLAVRDRLGAPYAGAYHHRLSKPDKGQALFGEGDGVISFAAA